MADDVVFPTPASASTTSTSKDVPLITNDPDANPPEISGNEPQGNKYDEAPESLANDPSAEKVADEINATTAKTLADDNQTYDKPNRMVLENGVDYDAASDTGPARQGNAYGVAIDSLLNFKLEAEGRLRGLKRDVEKIEQEIQEFESKLSEAGYSEDELINENILDEMNDPAVDDVDDADDKVG